MLEHKDEIRVIIEIVVFVGGIIGVFIRGTRFFIGLFTEQKTFIIKELSKRDRAIRRLEFWAFRQDTGFQPGVDPIEFDNGGG